MCFFSSAFSKAELYVPSDDLGLYNPMEPWNRFSKIFAIKDVSSIEIQAIGGSEMETGSTLQLNLIASDSPGLILNATTWISSDPNIASVDNNGLVTALSQGSITITANYGDLQASLIIHVKGDNVAGFNEVAFDDVLHPVFTLQGVCIIKNASKEEVRNLLVREDVERVMAERAAMGL